MLRIAIQVDKNGAVEWENIFATVWTTFVRAVQSGPFQPMAQARLALRVQWAST
jgi:hypothetical protein